MFNEHSLIFFSTCAAELTSRLASSKVHTKVTSTTHDFDEFRSAHERK
jgi:hypothetical protein